MSFIQFIRILWARRLVVLIATIGALAAGAIIAKVMPTRYEATSRLLLDVARPDPVSGEGIASGFMKAYVKTQSELIKDYRVAGRVVDQLGWTRSPLYAAAYRARPRSDNRDFRRWVSQTVIDGTTVELADQSNVLEITYRSTNPEAARTIADAIRDAYVEQTLSFKRDAAARSSEFFKIQAERMRAQLSAAEQRKTAFERANGILLQADNTDTQEERLKALAGATAAPVAAQVAAPAAVSASAGQLAQIDAQIVGAAKSLGPNNPQLQAMQRQRAAIAAAAASETAAARASMRGVAGPSAVSQFQAQQQRVLQQRDKVNEAQSLAVDVAVLRDQFNKTAARAAELQQQANSTESGITLLGSAVAPSSPSFPNIPLIIFGSLGMGLALGILTALVVELLSRRIRGIDDLEYIGVPVIGVMSRDRRATRLRLLSPSDGFRKIGSSPA